MRLALTPIDDTLTGDGTTTYPAVYTELLDGFAATVEATGDTGITSLDVTIEESADDGQVPDASAKWLTLVTFAQLTGDGSEKKTVTGPHFSRLRVKAVQVTPDSEAINLAVTVAGRAVGE